MADVFISYAREDRERAASVASALAAIGWSVWWDRKVIAGETFDEVIERELDAARCVLVLWSHSSIQSEWVKNEAAVAAERKVLVPAMVDEVTLPLEFRRRQTVSLVGWKSDPSHAGFRLLCEAIATKVETPADAQPRETMPNPPAPRRLRKSLWVPAAMVVLVMVVGVGAWMLGRGLNRNSPSPTSQSTTARPAPRPTTTANEDQTRIPPIATSGTRRPPSGDGIGSVSRPSWESLAGRWNVTQVHEDGTTYHGLLTINATASGVPGGGLTWRNHPPGRVAGGSLRGNRLRLVLRYRDGAEGTYDAIVDDSQRRITEGKTVASNGATARWSATRGD